MSDVSVLPSEFVERLGEIFPEQEKSHILKSFSHPKPISFRINTLKSSQDEILKVFADKNLKITPLNWSDNAFTYEGAKIDLTSLPEYIDGKLYIQGLSSMIPALVLDPKPDDKILDIAAAPGSKTTQIATMMNNQGELVANDMSRTRIFKLRDNLKQQGVTSVTVLNQPGERLWRRYPEYFDKVLVDVPCSMEGRFTTADPDSYTDWSVKKVKELAHRQQYLLRSAITATKMGGTIIYSTCTLAPEENEGVIDWILEKEGDNISIEKIEIPNLTLSPGLTTWKNKSYNPEVEKSARINPSSEMEGFFVAKIRKNKTTLTLDLLKQLKNT